MINQTPQASADEIPASPGFDEDDDDDNLLDTKQPGKRRHRRRTVVIISIVLVILILGGLLFTFSATRKPVFSYTTQPVQQGTLVLTVNATGSVQGAVYNVDFSSSGTLSAIDVSVGQQVQQGQTLAQLSVTSPQTGVTQTITLTAPHAGTVATINGSVGGVPGVPTTVGTTTAGANTPFIQIVDLSSLQVYANVNEVDIAGVENGQQASFTVSAYGSRQFTGTVKAISPLGQTASGVVTYPAIIQVNMSSLNGAQLLPGMAATTTITTVTRPGALLIPTGAITFAQSATASGETSVPDKAITQSEVQSAQAQAQQMLRSLESDKTSVAQDNPMPSYVLVSVNQQLVIKPVVLGLTDGTSYDVLAGLSRGDPVVTTSQQNKRGLFGGGGLLRRLAGGKGS